jgi:large subunit ribosomal protein L10
MPTVEKEQEIAALAERVEGARSVVLAEYAGLNVEKVTALRRKCRESGIEYRVTKNTLLKLALNARGVTVLDDYLSGPLAVVFGKDEVTAAKVLHDFSKDGELPKLKAGIVDGKLYKATELVALAKLPGKTELLTRLVYTLQSPARQLVTVLSAPARNLVMVLGQIEKQKGATG